MLSTIAYLLAIAYLPGAVIFRLPIADRAKRAALPAEERLFWVVVLSLAVSATAAFLLAAMSAYSLEWLAGISVGLAVILALASFGDLRLGAAAPWPRWTAALPAALIAAGIWMFFAVPASEWVLGGRDPGVYMNSGIQIAQRQSLVTTDRVIADVPPPMRDLFFPYTGQPGYYGDRFMGFQIRDPDAGTVTALFPQGFPIWIAIAYGLDGVTGTRRVVAWWAILGALAVYFAAARLIAPLPAAAAAALLTVHVVQTWYARYPNSEIVTQALLFSALLAHAYAHEDDDRFFGPVAASLLGLALFTRFPTIIAIGAAVVASVLAHVSGHRMRAGFLITMTAWLGAASVYYMTQLRPYFTRPITYFQNLQPVHVVPLVAGAAAVLALLWAIRKPPAAAATRKWLPLALIIAVVSGAIYALFLREPGGRLAPHDAHSLKVFVYLYFTLTAFGLALVGYALVVWRSFWRAPALILALTTMAFFFFYKMRVWPEHFWLARRFVDALLPGALIFASAALFAPLWMIRGPDPRMRKVVRPVAAVIGTMAVLFLGQRYLAAAQPIRTHVEYADIIPRLERLAAGFGNKDLVIVEGRAASDLHTLALPLSYIWARNVLVMYSSRPDKPQLVEFLAWARSHYDNVYFIGGGGTDLLSPGIRLETIKSEAFVLPQYELTHYAVYPSKSRTKPFNLTVYRFVEGSMDEGAFRIDVGAADDLHVIRFHGKERWGAGETTFRWTRDRSYFSVPKVSAANRELVVRMGNGGRPAKVPPPQVTIFLSDRAIGKTQVDGGFRDYAFTIPAELAAELARRSSAAEIRIESTTWTPQEVLGNSDERQLGVMIDRAEIR
jgi:hypothetical protein